MSGSPGNRRSASKALPPTYELHGRIIEFLPDATFVIDRTGAVIAWNRAIEEMTRIRKKDILSQSGYAYALPFYGERRPILIDLVLVGDPRFEQTYDFTSREENTLVAEVFSSAVHGGRGAYLWGKASPLFDDEGDIVGAIESIRDITERKHAEFELKSSRQRLEILFEYAPDAMFLTDARGALVAANRAAEAMTGYSRADVAGKSILELRFLLPEELPKAVDILASNSLGWHTGPNEFELVRKDGSRIMVELRTFPTRIEGQTLLLGSARDISGHKKNEAALRESERQLKLLSSKLLVAQEEERKRIAADLHDSIGSYLTGIKLGLENLVVHAESNGLPHNSLKSLVGVTQGALEETRRIMTDLRPSILDDLGIVATIGWFCRQCRTLYPDLAIDERITIEEKDVPENLKITIFRIIQEAVNNAAKYSGSDLLDLSLESTGKTIRLIVEDYGEGFDVEATTSKCGTHRGMGLAGMKERVELSSGVISIRSVPGMGTRICASWELKPSDRLGESDGNSSGKDPPR
ncbi:MAG: PAS domain S-box protein [Syntrophobacteraceae bacterium]